MADVLLEQLRGPGLARYTALTALQQSGVGLTEDECLLVYEMADWWETPLGYLIEDKVRVHLQGAASATTIGGGFDTASLTEPLPCPHVHATPLLLAGIVVMSSIVTLVSFSLLAVLK